MSTNSAIGVVIKGKIHAVYCHWDGYVSYNGKLLVEHYAVQRTAEKLVAEGDISSLKSTIGRKHPFDSYKLSDAERELYKDMTTFYGRDRNESDTRGQVFDTAEEFVEYYAGGEFWYLLGADGVWYVSEGRPEDWKAVTEVLAKETV